MSGSRRLTAKPLLTMAMAAMVVVTTLVALPQPAQAAGPAWPRVQQGASGPNVRAIQLLLLERGHAITVDGEFGPETDSFVRTFQRRQGLAVDGVVGAETWPVLVPDLEPGVSGDHVRAAKHLLNKHGNDFVIGPLYHDAMADEVRRLKVAWGLPNNALIGTPFWRYLLGFDGLVNAALPIPPVTVTRPDLSGPHHDYPAIDIMVDGVAAIAMVGGTIDLHSSFTCGTGIRILLSGDLRIVYCHLSARSVVQGQRVQAGDRIGTTGNSGPAGLAPHLHIQILTADEVNHCPQSWLLAVFDHRPPPPLSTLPTSGCFFVSSGPAQF